MPATTEVPASKANATSRRSVISLGALCMLGSAFFFSVMSMLVKQLGQRLPSQEVVLARAFVGAVLSYAMVRHARLSPWGVNRRLLVLRGLFGFGALSCFFFALTRLPIAEATVIQFTSPIWTTALAALFLGERVGKRLAVCGAVSLIGVVLVARPGFLFGNGTAGLDPVGLGVAILGSLLTAAAYVTVRKASRTDDPLVIVFYFAWIAVVLGIPTAAPILIMPSGWEWAMMAAVGVTTQIAQVFLTQGLKLETAGRATSVGYAQIVFATMWGMIFFSELPDALAAAGAALIVASTVTLAVTKPGSRSPGA